MKLVGINISKKFSNNTVLDSVSFQVDTGEIFGLFGRNGSGKSTLLKILFGQLEADSGDFFLNQEAYKPYKSFGQQKVAYLPQSNMYPKNLKVRDLIPMMIPEGETQDKVFYAPGIENYTRKWVGSLSEGERTHLGVVLSCHLPHPVLLLDEPFSMTDPLTIQNIKDQIVKVSEYKSIIITDHYYKDVLDITTKSALMQDGKLLEIKDVEDLRAHGYTR